MTPSTLFRHTALTLNSTFPNPFLPNKEFNSPTPSYLKDLTEPYKCPCVQQEAELEEADSLSTFKTLKVHNIPLS